MHNGAVWKIKHSYEVNLLLFCSTVHSEGDNCILHTNIIPNSDRYGHVHALSLMAMIIYVSYRIKLLTSYNAYTLS